MAQRVQGAAGRSDFADIVLLARNQDIGCANFHPRPHWLGAEYRKKRTEYRAGFQAAERGKIEFRNPAKQRKDLVTGSYAQILQQSRKTVGLRLHLRIAIFPPGAIPCDPAKRWCAAPPFGNMAIHGLIGDIEHARSRAAHGLPNILP